MTDFKVALRGTLDTTVDGEEIIATTAEAIAGTRNDVIATPASVANYVGANVVSGLMPVAIYDPQGIANDAFARANQTGTQAISTVTGLQTALDGKATAAQGALADTAVQPGDLATVATTGDYDDLTGKPTLGTAAAQNSTAFATAAQGVTADTAVQPGDLATVATTGDYDDLTGLPTLGTAAAQNSTAFATAAQGATADTAVQPGDLGDLALQNTISVPGDISATGTPSATTYLRGDGTWATPAGGGGGGGQVNTIVEGTGIDVDSTDPVNPVVSIQSGYLAAVATTGAYADLSGAPALAAVATTGAYADLSGTPTLATVATTGAYSDLSGLPTLGTAAAQNSTAFATAAQGATADTALQPAAVGVTVQGYDADLASWAGVTRASGFDTFAATPSSANFAALVTGETGTGALVFATSPTLVTPVLGAASATSLTLTTDLAVADGGTGASSASAARANLGVVPGTDVQAYSALLASVAALSYSGNAGKVIAVNGAANAFELIDAGGGSVIQSIQTGYVSGANTTGTGEDLRYIDVTISAVTIAKCVLEAVGGSASNEGNSFFRGGATAATELSPRLTSTTNLRLSSSSAGGANISGRWTVVEYK